MVEKSCKSDKMQGVEDEILGVPYVRDDCCRILKITMQFSDFITLLFAFVDFVA